MKIKIINWILAIILVYAGGGNLLADSSDVNNYTLTAQRMHDQEVLLKLQLDRISESDHYYLIKKTLNGVDYQTIFELEVDKINTNQIVFADHLPENVITEYQLSKVGINGEEVISTATYDPEADIVPSANSRVGLNEYEGLSPGDPHSL